METLQINTTFDKGEEFLAVAHHALNYADQEDTAYMVCTNAKSALSNYLISFLDHYGERVYSEDPEVLLNQCRELSGNYFDLHIHELKRWQNGEIDASINLGKQVVFMAEFARELMVCELI
ncbi:MAG: hypothetical protein CMB80_07440 [Flammeovirgaceae bacterium]|nr:hypothetical protein [Flammeovirgaceae bacterium]MBE62985.1 hypothetical protein [Flammeovirgaceae bacterium]|tara:strand:+ start:278 stop:640 length:363 start_codon:yes stop_codon:yes gene_type:complete